MCIEKFLTDAGAALVGGAALTTVIFVLKEHVYALPEINGTWWVQTTTTSAAYKPYVGMLLKYEVIIWQEGARIHGSTEKIFEDSVNDPRQFEGKNRSLGKIDGYVSQSYLPRKNQIRLHIEEKGIERASTLFFDLLVRKPEKLGGIFTTTAGSASGNTIWSRNRYDPQFEPSIQKEDSAKEGKVAFIAAQSIHLEAE